MPEAILFGAIGTIVETSQMERRAFTEAFAEAGLAWEWTPEVHAELLGPSGGSQRIEDVARRQGTRADPVSLHRRKTELFLDHLHRTPPVLRPGVASVLTAARKAGVRLGFVAEAEQDVVSVLRSVVQSAIGADPFDFVGNREIVEHRRPAPDIFRIALETLGVDADNAVAIEESPRGASAARAAGLPVIAFPGAIHATAGFGDVLARRARLTPADFGLSGDAERTTLESAGALP